MGLSFGDLIAGKWYVMLGVGGAFLIFVALVMDPAIDPLLLALSGAGLVAFGCARSECMTFQQSILDARCAGVLALVRPGRRPCPVWCLS